MSEQKSDVANQQYIKQIQQVLFSHLQQRRSICSEMKYCREHVVNPKDSKFITDNYWRSGECERLSTLNNTSLLLSGIEGWRLGGF